MNKYQSKPVEKEWSFLVYIAGDNNLSNAGLEDIQELCGEGTSPDVNVGVEIDTYGEFTGSIRYEITEPDWTGQAHRIVIERLPEKDSGDPETLTSFLNWGMTRYPALRKIVVIWNHGAGFRSVRRDIGYDDFGSSLDMPEIERAFQRARITSNNKIDILGFDACLMNMIEIAHHFREQVEIIVGSQETEPGDGWPYDKVLNAIKSSTSSQELAKKIVQRYIEDYTNIGITNVTQSAVDTSKTEDAIQALSDLGNILAKNINNFKPDLKRLRPLLQSFEYADYVDLVYLAKKLPDFVTDSSVKTASTKVEATTKACILYSDNFGRSVQNANGLSVWFPADPWTYFNYRSKYISLDFADNWPGWLNFLDAYFAD